jgi:hypothetical protein
MKFAASSDRMVKNVEMDRMKKEAVTGQFTLPFRHSPGEIE